LNNLPNPFSLLRTELGPAPAALHHPESRLSRSKEDSRSSLTPGCLTWALPRAWGSKMKGLEEVIVEFVVVLFY
jgi:hypothetical protein